MNDKLLLSPDEAFHSLGVGRAKGYQMIATGELPSIKVGRLRRIPTEALENYVKRQIEEQIGGEETRNDV